MNESHWKIALKAFFTSWLENIKIIIIVDDDGTGTGVIQRRFADDCFFKKLCFWSKKLVGECNFCSGWDNFPDTRFEDPCETKRHLAAIAIV